MAGGDLGRLFSLMEGVDPEGLFNAALLRAAGGGDLGPAGLSLQLPPQLQGMEGLGASQMEDLVKGEASGDLEGGGSTDDETGSVGGAGGAVPPRTGSINDRKCTKVLPASSSAPKYKFVVPNEYVYKFMKHLVERPFHMRDPGGKLWDCVLIQRKNKEKYEYMIQGWRRFGEASGVQEGDTVTIEMVDDSVLQLTLEQTGGPAKKRPRKAGGGGHGTPPPGGAPCGAPGGFGPPGDAAAAAQRAQLAAAARQEVEVAEQQQNGMLAPQGMLGGPSRGSQQQGGMSMAATASQQQQQQPAPYSGAGGLADGPGGPRPGGGGASQGLLALIQQQHAAAGGPAAQGGGMMGGGGGVGGGGQPLTPRSLSAHLANGLSGPLGQLGGLGGINDAQLADLSAVISQLERRQRGGDGGGGGGGPGGAMQLLSDVADLDKLIAENMALREELRLSQAKVATLETGVLNIKSVLTRNTDPGLIAMTGVINLLARAASPAAPAAQPRPRPGACPSATCSRSRGTHPTASAALTPMPPSPPQNQMESPEFLPELGTIGRMTLTGLCSEVRRHLNGVLRMVWILRSLPDDVQQHNIDGSEGPASAGAP